MARNPPCEQKRPRQTSSCLCTLWSEFLPLMRTCESNFGLRGKFSVGNCSEWAQILGFCLKFALLARNSLVPI
eukprot:3876755-Rhodomonas_salina.1